VGRKAGLCLHLTSLPAPYGSGDIGDAAAAFVDILARLGIGVWQFLPTGPTGYGNSPYQPLSAFAGNPLLIGLEPLVRLGLLHQSDLDELAGLPHAYLDFERVLPAKSVLLLRASERFHAGRFPGLRTAYDEFLHDHDEAWLGDYALFRILKTMHGEQAWTQWDEPYLRRGHASLNTVLARNRAAAEHIKFAQFLFELQWRQLKCIAAENGICLFGDLPIYIALDSADAWAHPEMLLLDANGRPSHVAGVPPDYFSTNGQLWGNPLYDWDFHRRDGYRWWIDRMRHALQLTPLVRIDHFRGFESYWAVPSDAETARLGSWLPGPGDAIFEALAQSLGRLPIVAEDLGMITPEVTALRTRHGFPGMRVLQFEAADPGFELDSIEKNCVCYTGTHDNDTIVGWLQGSSSDSRGKEEILMARKQVLHLTGGTPRTVHLDLIRLAFSSKAALAIAPMQDFLGLGSEARMNIPGTTLGNWRWRLRPEALRPVLLDQAAELISNAGRAGPAHLGNGNSP